MNLIDCKNYRATKCISNIDKLIKNNIKITHKRGYARWFEIRKNIAKNQEEITQNRIERNKKEVLNRNNRKNWQAYMEEKQKHCKKLKPIQEMLMIWNREFKQTISMDRNVAKFLQAFLNRKCDNSIQR